MHCCTCFVLAACGNNSSNNKDNQSSSKDKDTLRVGTEGTYAPFTYHNKKDQLTGYDIDVIKAVAKKKILNLSLMKRHGIQCLQD